MSAASSWPAGAACREPLQLQLPPLALSSAGLFVVAVCDDGVYAFDRNSSRQVQQIEYAHDDTYVGLSQRLPTAADAGGRCICLATSSLVLWLEPVALEQQVGPIGTFSLATAAAVGGAGSSGLHTGARDHRPPPLFLVCLLVCGLSPQHLHTLLYLIRLTLLRVCCHVDWGSGPGAVEAQEV